MTHGIAEARLAPIPRGERIDTLDVLRGFALLGILLMNIEAMVGPVMAAGTGLDPTLSGADRWVDGLIAIFVQGKFFTLFSLLFGMGFAVMSQRAQATGSAFAGIYWRRSLVLAGIGLLHGVLVWSGDILLTYALLSFFLLAFRDVSGRWLAGLAIACFMAPLGLMLALGAVGSMMQATPELAASWARATGSQGEMVSGMIEGQRLAFGSGSYLDATLQRARDMGFSLLNLVTVGPLVFGMFLLGSWFMKAGAMARPERFRRLFTKLRWGLFPAGLAVVLFSFFLQPTLDLAAINMVNSLAFCMNMLGGALMCLGYAGWVVRGMQSPGSARALAWLAPAGRMALTNYLVQSLVCTLVFYGYGLGYFERLPRAWQVPFVLALFAVQVLASRWWLQRFRFGPMEWLWRSLTYLELQPMRPRSHELKIA